MSQRQPVIAGNWKMHKTPAESRDFVAALPDSCRRQEAVQAILCAPFTSLGVLQEALSGSQIQLGAQNIYHAPQGAFTGEVSAGMLLASGCSHVIIGHSERREYFHENDVLINLKVKAALEAGLNPILCVGESLSEREQGGFEAKILNQVELGLSGVNLLPTHAERLLIAYEPIWAIGTGKTCDDSEANRMLGLIRQHLARLYGQDRASALRLLYGGSVKPGTIAAQIQQPDIDGALVGGASLEPASFAELVQLAGQYGA